MTKRSYRARRGGLGIGLVCWLGVACGSSGRLDDAIAAYTEAMQHGEAGIGRATAHIGIAEAYQRKGATDEATGHRNCGGSTASLAVSRLKNTARSA